MSATLETNKQIVRDFFEAVNRNDADGISAKLHEDLDWWIVGAIKISGHKNKRAMALGFKLIHRVFEGFHFVLEEFTAESDRVAVTAQSHAVHPSGRKYNNHYHFLFKIHDGLIANVKEYFDTHHAEWIEHG
ncbi:MAG: nuclear transport factor 2 family protein [Spirochaetales bacterium]|nr:nuclear transport factor 2 family protein [Leptospiraceae bacterium]MCP5481320.1 nuclear transport factor 2 family protein [Spirochaetales bacterium]MCP5485756.1 nuclear transport factor 2 family protein [Spirochaetales bacterium]